LSSSSSVRFFLFLIPLFRSCVFPPVSLSPSS
jgi:hypothetical protein